MSTRHQRRKAAKANAQRKLEGLAQAARAAEVAAIVRKNKSQPIERNYYPSSIMGRLAESAAFGRVASNVSHVEYETKGTVANGFNSGSTSRKVNGLWNPKKG